jgi:hypothetical protein
LSFISSSMPLIALVSAAFIVTVHKNDLGPDLVLFPGPEMLNPSKPDNVFLEAAPCFSSNALLLCAYGNPTILAHLVENGGSRKKTVSFRNAVDWLGSENTGSKTAHFILTRIGPELTQNCARHSRTRSFRINLNQGTSLPAHL